MRELGDGLAVRSVFLYHHYTKYPDLSQNPYNQSPAVQGSPPGLAVWLLINLSEKESYPQGVDKVGITLPMTVAEENLRQVGEVGSMSLFQSTNQEREHYDNDGYSGESRERLSRCSRC